MAWWDICFGFCDGLLYPGRQTQTLQLGDFCLPHPSACPVARLLTPPTTFPTCPCLPPPSPVPADKNHPTRLPTCLPPFPQTDLPPFPDILPIPMLPPTTHSLPTYAYPMPPDHSPCPTQTSQPFLPVVACPKQELPLPTPATFFLPFPSGTTWCNSHSPCLDHTYSEPTLPPFFALCFCCFIQQEDRKDMPCLQLPCVPEDCTLLGLDKNTADL